MLKKITEWIVKYFDKFVYSVVITASVFSFCLLFFPAFLPIIDDNDRVGIVQLLFEIAGVLALIFAALEFRKSQRKPKLDLGLSNRSLDHPEFEILKEYDYLVDRVNWPIRFHTVLENYGDALGRWIKIKLSLRNSNPNYSIRFYKESEDTDNYWKPTGDNPAFTHYFDGKDSFVHYSKNRTQNNPGECHILGDFRISVVDQRTGQIPDCSLILDYSIKADGMDEVNGILTMRIHNN
ncbi:MAG: hypothetical protein DWQ07_21415 [Chloroflexi bacterium]|nr:MAG: hypothetical protein DWQ07_21415 [Chloroflexota bacterium]MBL1196619.1 hypothetical protein [Chloroflexota bacterium]NOH13912.1 hypothetical protein [Chloroflexota bacterium]